LAYENGTLAALALAPPLSAVLSSSSPSTTPAPVIVTLHTLALALTGFVALQHLGFLVLEMFYWDHPVGRRIFRLEPEFSRRSRALAANQGLYNGFLAAGLTWGIACGHDEALTFFLVCVVIAGTFGAATVSRRILVIQALPAAIALIALLAA
jgi:putative membrane protein